MLYTTRRGVIRDMSTTQRCRSDRPSRGRLKIMSGMRERPVLEVGDDLLNDRVPAAVGLHGLHRAG
jgi:hypothetical protein